MGKAARKEYKYTQNYPTERKDYPSGTDDHPSEELTNKVVELHKKSREKSKSDQKSDQRPETNKGKHDYKPVQGDPEEGGKISPDEAERISSGDLPS